MICIMFETADRRHFFLQPKKTIQKLPNMIVLNVFLSKIFLCSNIFGGVNTMFYVYN